MVALAAAPCSLPHRTSVERLEPTFARLHVAEAAQPHEAVRVVEIPELAENLHAERLLRLDELTVEEFDQRVARAGAKGIAAQLDYGAGLVAHSSARGRWSNSRPSAHVGAAPPGV
jgi:hypothetical protein